MAKLISADKGNTPGSVAAAPTLQPQVLQQSGQSMNFTGQVLNQTAQKLGSSLQGQAQVAQQMSQDALQTTETVLKAQTSALQAQGGDNGFKQALGNLAQVGQMVAQTLDNKEKQYQQSKAAVQAAQSDRAWERVSQMSVDAARIARSDPGGITKLSTDFEKAISQFDVTSDERAKLYKHWYGEILRPLEAKQVDELIDGSRKVQDEMGEANIKKTMVVSSTLLVGIANAADDESRNSLLKRFNDEIIAPAVSGNQRPIDKARLLSAVYDRLGSLTYSSADNQAKLESHIQNVKKFIEAADRVNHENATDPANARRQIAVLATAYKIDGSLASAYDPLAGVKAFNDAEGEAQRTEAYKEKAQEIRYGKISASDFEIGAIVQTIRSEGDLKKFIAANPGYKLKHDQVTAAFNDREAYVKANGSLRVELAELDVRKQNIASGMIDKQISLMSSLKPSESNQAAKSIAQQLAGLTGMTPNIQAVAVQAAQYDAMDQAAKEAWQQQVISLYEQGALQQQDVVAAIDNLAKTKIEQVNQLYGRISQYGLNQDGVLDPKAEKHFREQRAQLQVQYAPQNAGLSGGTPTPAPFKFQRIQGGMGSLILPTKVPYNKDSMIAWGNMGEWRGNRAHAGEDVAMPVGTPLIALMKGKVKDVWGEHEGGAAGAAVVVEYEDGSEHKYFHLQTTPNLAVGAPIMPGQVIGKSGNTGRSTGPHLHWEVRDRAGNNLGPYKWSAGVQDRPQTKHRSPETALTNRATPPGTIAIRGGFLQIDPKTFKLYSSTGTDGVPTPAHIAALPQPVRVQPSRSNRVFVQRTGNKTAEGLEELVVTLYDKAGNGVGRYITNSGSPAMQGKFGPGGTTTPDINAPMEFGKYTIGQNHKDVKTAGIGGNFIDISPQFKTRRKDLGIHFDADRDVAPGSAGCLVFGSNSEFQRFQGQLSQHGLKLLEFSPVKYSSAAPLRATHNTANPAEYDSSTTANHGYAFLKQNPSYARRLNSIAQRMGFPGAWLADSIADETGNTWSTSIKHSQGEPAVGLIQFYEDPGTPGVKTINGKRYRLADIGRMDFNRQMDVVEDYLIEAVRNAGGGKISDPHDIRALIWANRFARQIPDGESDGYITWGELKQRSGKFVGRKYSAAPIRETDNVQNPYTSDRTNRLTRPVDHRYVASCSMCNQMASIGGFVPHETQRSLNKGDALFRLA